MSKEMDEAAESQKLDITQNAEHKVVESSVRETADYVNFKSPKEIQGNNQESVNGLISETLKEGKAIVEESVKEIVSFSKSSEAAVTKYLVEDSKSKTSEEGNDSGLALEKAEQSVQESIQASPVPAAVDDSLPAALSLADPNTVLVEEETEVLASTVTGEKEELKSSVPRGTEETGLPISSDHTTVGDSSKAGSNMLVSKENVEVDLPAVVEAVSIVEKSVPENTEENQPSAYVTTPQPLKRSSWKDCCGVFDALRRSNH